jgi:type IV pilus biogenesis protein PilP
MKTEFKRSKSLKPSLALVGVLLGTTFLAHPAVAAAVDGAVTPSQVSVSPTNPAVPPLAAPAVPPTGTAMPSAPPPGITPLGLPPVAAAAPMAAPMIDAPKDIMMPPKMTDIDKGDKGKKGIENVEEEVTDSVKDVLKRLSEVENDMTIDDLNSARQAIAKMDVLIDIEKKLGEYEKLKSERESKAGISAIPASALGLPPGMGRPGMPPMMPGGDPAAMGMPPVFMSQNMNNVEVSSQNMNNVEVSRIIGGGGRYTAMIKSPGGEDKTMQVGDRLSDGTKITSITAAGVELGEGEKKRFIRVKDVDTVFGGIP